MFNKKILVMLCLIICLFSIAGVAASDAVGDDNVTLSAVGNEQLVIAVDESNDDVLSTAPKTFTDLNGTINGDNSSEVYLDFNYSYDGDVDSGFKGGISIDRPVTIYGNGHTIDGCNVARIFNGNSKVVLNNIIFTNAANCAVYRGSAVNCTFINNSNSMYGDGGAIEDCSYVVNCTFINNSAYSGGAVDMFGGSAVNCTFINNSAVYGGAMCGGTAVNCTFINNSAKYGGAVYSCTVYDSLFEHNCASEGGAMSGSTAVNCTFNYNNASKYGGAVYRSRVSDSSQFNNNSPNDTYDVTIFKYDPKSFYGLKKAIMGNFDSEIYLDSDYSFCSGYDLGRIYVSRPLTIYGNNHKIDGKNLAGIFDMSLVKGTITIYNLTFANAICAIDMGEYVGAKCTVVNCTFINNRGFFRYSSDDWGTSGAIEGNSYAVNCTFINNSAKYGGAIYGSTAVNCTFINNSAKYGGATFDTNVVNCTFVNNSAEYGGAMFAYLDSKMDSAVNCTFVGNSAQYGSACHHVKAEYCNFTGNRAYVSGLNYNGTNINCTFENNFEAMATKLISSGLSTVYKGNKYLVVTLRGINNKPVVGVKVTIKLSNGNTFVRTTDRNGQVKLSVYALAPNKYVAAISFAGNANYVASSKSVYVIVKKANPKLYAPAKIFKRALKVKKYTIILKNNRNQILKNSRVFLNVNGRNYVAIVNARGQATFNIINLNKKATFKATVRYAGSAHYNARVVNTKIIVR